MKSVKKIIKKRLLPYNLRSRKPVKRVKSSTPRVNREVQACLSEDHNCTLLFELPYHPSLLNAPTSVLNSSEAIQPSHSTDQPRYSTAFSEPTQANHTNHEAIDISLEPAGEAAFVQPSTSKQITPDRPREASSSSSLEDFTPIDSRILHSGPRIALQVEEISEASVEGPISPTYSHAVGPINKGKQIINSNSDTRPEVTSRINYKKPKQTKKLIRSDSVSSEEFSSTETESEREYSEDSGDKDIQKSNRKIIKESGKSSSEEEKGQDKTNSAKKMEKEFLEEQQRLLTALTQGLASKDVRIDKFHGYENEDINRWFDKLELQLEAKRIRTTDPVAISQVVSNLSGPAETFLFELPNRERHDYASLEQALQRRYSTKDRAWVRRQRLVARKQGQHKPLSDYINEMHELFSGLAIKAEKVTYFTEGLHQSLKIKVLERMPANLFEAEEIARTVDSISRINRPNNEENLEKMLTALLTQNQNKSANDYHDRPTRTEDKKTLESMVEEILQRKTAKEDAVHTKLESYINEKINKPNEQEQSNTLLSRLDEILEKATRRVDDVPSQVRNSASLPGLPTRVAYLDSQSTRADLPASQSDLQQLQEMMKELLGRENPRGNFAGKYTASLAALSNSSNLQDIIHELRRLEGKVEENNRHVDENYRRVDARINGLVRKSPTSRDDQFRQRSRDEQPRQRTREGQPICYNCGRVGHLQQNCNQRFTQESANNGRFQSSQPRRQQYDSYPRSGYNPSQRRDALPSMNTRGPRLAVLDEEYMMKNTIGSS